MSHPALPPEFFQVAELIALSDRTRRADICAWLREAGIAHVVGRHGWPLVYRDKLLPGTATKAQTEPAFNYSAANASRRPAPIRG